MADQTNNLLLVDGTTNLPTKYKSGDTIQIAELDLTAASGTALAVTADASVGGELSVTGDASIGGDLSVQGDIISRGQVDVVIQDAFLDLGFGNSTTTANSGGFTVSMNRAASFTAGTVTTFVAGSAGVSNPTFTYTDATGSTLFAVGDIVAISGAAEAGNDGLFQVTAVSGAAFPQTVTIAGVGTTAVDGALPFCQNQFEASTGDTASAYKVDLAVVCIADGSNSFTDAGGTAYAKGQFVTAFGGNATLGDFDGDGDYAPAASTLQSAYDGGNAITTSGTKPVSITMASDAAGLSVQGQSAGDGNVDFGGTNAVSSFNVASDGSVTLDAGAASALSTSAGALTLAGAAGVTVTSTGGQLSLNGTGQTVDLNSAALDIDASDAITIDSTAGISLDAGAASNLTTSAGALTLDGNAGVNIAGNAAEIDITTTGALDINSGAATWDASSLSLDSTDTTNLTMSANAGGNKILTIAAANAGGGEGQINIASDSQVTIGDGTLSLLLDGGALSESGLTSLDLSGSSTATIYGASGANFGESASHQLAYDADGGATITFRDNNANAFRLRDAGGSPIEYFNIDSTDGGPKVTLGSPSAKVEVDATFGSGEIRLKDNENSAFTVQEGSNVYVSFRSTNGGEAVNFSVPAILQSGDGSTPIGQNAAAGENIAVGDVLAYSGTDGRVFKADCDNAQPQNAVGIALSAQNTPGQPLVYAFSGIASATFTGNIATTDIGKPVYVSPTAGRLQLTVPNAAGQRVFRMGVVSSADGSATATIALQPSFVMDIPA